MRPTGKEGRRKNITTCTHDKQLRFRDAKTITSKFLRHQAFQSELQSNKERLDELRHAALRLSEEKPEFALAIEPQVGEIAEQWEKLEETTEQKGQKLFDANRQQLYVQSIADMRDWAQQLEQQIDSGYGILVC